jgi:A/G-specific adenine glycosylase
VVRVIPRLIEWLDRWPTPAALAAVPPGEAVRAWASLGYPRRALWLHACAVAITDSYGGVVPSHVAELITLPGVGAYTARAVAAFAYGRREAVVDTNIRRVIARAFTGVAEAAAPSIRRDITVMGALLPENPAESVAFNAGMMELGALICTARNPSCDNCPLRELCVWRARGYPAHSGVRRATQKKFEGSDRQVRGLIMAELRASHVPVTVRDISRLWPDRDQRARALAGLVADGLAVREGDGYVLP